MRGALLLPAAAVCLGVAPVSAAARRVPTTAPPVVVELYTAQGCTSCPPANKLLSRVADRQGVLMLTFPVDYWDYAGWRDTFAKPEFTARQRAYADRLKVREIYTPEVVVGGRKEAPGGDADKIDALIAAAPALREAAPRVRITGERVRVEPRPGLGGLDVWLVRYDPQERVVKVKTGDNKGKSISQRDVVRQLVRLGGVYAHARSFALPAAEETGLKTAILVQGLRGGPILAVAQPQ